jgi:hypothetical protein
MTNGRIAYLDMLRGLAAVAVMLHHYGERIGWHNVGNMGVPVFFVLSGYVIAMSVGSRPPRSWSFLGRFALKRSIRLDPPYWLSIAGVLVLGYIGAQFGIRHEPAGLGQVAAHLFYLQGILNYPQIQAVYWTLCYEIQFYLALILLLWVARGMFGFILLATLAVSIADRFLDITNDAVMLRHWFCFALGAITRYASSWRLPQRYFLAALLLVTGYGFTALDGYAITAGLTALLIYAVVALNRESFGSWAPLQFLGRISYSLYLTHLIGGWLVLSMALRYMPGWLAMLLASAVAIVSAWVFYLFAEAPAVRWSRLFHLQRSPNTAAEATPA